MRRRSSSPPSSGTRRSVRTMSTGYSSSVSSALSVVVAVRTRRPASAAMSAQRRSAESSSSTIKTLETSGRSKLPGTGIADLSFVSASFTYCLPSAFLSVQSFRSAASHEPNSGKSPIGTQHNGLLLHNEPQNPARSPRTGIAS